MAEVTTSNAIGKFKIGDFVWAKVKGFNYWPAQITKNTSIKFNKKTKNPQCVYFYGSNNYAVVGEDLIRPYEDFKTQFSSASKAAAFKQAIDAIEDAIYKKKKSPTGVVPPLPSSTANTISSSSSNVSSTTPDSNNKADILFKTNKKIVPSSSSSSMATTSAAAPVQRDYSRTPFKKEKRSFESALNESDLAKTKSSSKTEVSNEFEDRKRTKLTGTSSKIVPSSTVNSTSSSSTLLSSSSIKADKSSSSSNALSFERFAEKRTIDKANKPKPSALKFGFIGLGKMGQQLAKLLLDAGHDITVWNRTPSKCKDVEKFGASVVKTPGDVVRECDIIFSCLADSVSAQAIFFGNCGAVHEINATKGYVELTSMDFSASAEIEEAIKKKGGRYLESPFLVCSLPYQVQEGKLIAMVSGNRSLFDDCSTCFEAICSHVYFLSETAGIASKMNMVLSTYFGHMLGSLMECMNLVEKFELIPKDFVEIITNSSLGCELISKKVEPLLNSTLIRDIPFEHIRRDLNYCLTNANVRGHSTPITAITNEVFKQKKHHYL